MSANDRQVGGSHYKTSGLEHWDIVILCGVPYTLGCASKYLVRWREKGGVQDIEKALHYVDKTLENRVDLESAILQARSRYDTSGVELELIGHLPVREQLLVEGIMLPKSWLALASWRRVLYAFLTEQRSILRPGTPEDGGHHACCEDEATETPSEDDLETYTSNYLVSVTIAAGPTSKSFHFGRPAEVTIGETTIVVRELD